MLSDELVRPCALIDLSSHNNVSRTLCPFVQRTHEERRALFSCFYWAIFSWNRDEMGSQGEPPQLALWARLLVRPSGCVVRCVPKRHGAWHAGGEASILLLRCQTSM